MTERLTLIFKAINGVWLIITLLVFFVLIKLGLWQSDRAVEKEQRLARIESLTKQDAITLDKMVSRSQQLPENINDLPVVLEGSFEPEVLFLLDNQPNGKQLGYRVFQVFNHDDLSLLVNLGWIAGSRDRSELPRISALSGQMELAGHVRFIDVGIQLAEQNFEQQAWPMRVQQIEIDKISRLINKQLLPFTVFLDKKEAVGYKKNWQPIVMPPEKHRGYAFQWFSLAIAWLSLMIWAAIKTNKNNKNKAL